MMIKGSRRQVIVVRTDRSRYFDEAYFVLRRGEVAARGNHGDILREANRILEDSEPERGGVQRRRMPLLFFAVGLICGAVAAAIICLLL